MIGIIDYGLGNLGSLLNMCHKIGRKASLVHTEEEVLSASHLILPGVGTFDTGMRNLASSGLIPVLKTAVSDQKIPVLGICLGAQLMLESSEEGVLPGLGWINGRVIKFGSENGLKVPHMGWNSLTYISHTALYHSMPQTPPRFYFVHSYYLGLTNPENVSAWSNYGHKFAASFEHGNVMGVQFHPEKSHQFGMQLLHNFFEVATSNATAQ
jgi:glutamine amidotransferase